jgi:hypothetical protein
LDFKGGAIAAGLAGSSTTLNFRNSKATFFLTPLLRHHQEPREAVARSSSMDTKTTQDPLPWIAWSGNYYVYEVDPLVVVKVTKSGAEERAVPKRSKS